MFNIEEMMKDLLTEEVIMEKKEYDNKEPEQMFKDFLSRYDTARAYINEKLKTPKELLTLLDKFIKDKQKVVKSYEDKEDVEYDNATNLDISIVYTAEQLYDYLVQGTKDDLKRAQILLSSVSSPVSSAIPPEVIKYVYGLGQQDSQKIMKPVEK